MGVGRIIKISGPLVIAENMQDANIFDVVKVGSKNLIGEIIEMRDDKASIQVYEETSGLKTLEQVISTNEPLSVELGPGLLQNMFDGIQRPLEDIRRQVGDFLEKGVFAKALDREKKWEFKKIKNVGDYVIGGDIIGIVNETELIEHKIMVPYDIEGKIEEIKDGIYTVEETIAIINGKEINMIQKWPVRKSRFYKEKINPTEPLITGQRVIDTFFPVTKGGTACVPGPFGSGKTVVQHQFAKWGNSDIVIYVGCGERGNEMTDVLMEFPEIIDPKTGRSLMERTVLIANTSNMPVAAREASIYTGITIAEYFRDMGYSVSIMADSTSRWAEALREMSGRLEEMPGDEGYPAYLSSRVAEFYERAGKVKCLGSDDRIGALTVIGAVSPPGGDISEPVSQATLRIAKVFWGLDSSLAYRRHFPAINWLNSYSLYQTKVDDWMDNNIEKTFSKRRKEAMILLQEEQKLQEIVRLVGKDTLSYEDQLKLEISKSIREDFLQQNAFHDNDTYTSLKKQYKILNMIMVFYEYAIKAIKEGVYIQYILDMPIRENIARAKFTDENKIDDIVENIKKDMDTLITNLKEELL